jgi:hypothetical protein
MTDLNLLNRIQALLDKAVSTTFPAEAEALVAKAQELMTRHSIDEATLATRGRQRAEVITRSHLVEPPYATAKTRLLGAVLRNNGCRLVLHGRAVGARHCTLVGHPSDVEAAVVLYQTLVLHGVREMLRTPTPGPDNPRAFRHAFLLAFAARIGERLREAVRAATEEARGSGASTSAALVLADRVARVDAEVARLFPHLSAVRTSVSSGAGLSSGRSAADRAPLGRAVRSTPALPS